MRLAGIKKTTLLDYPGRVATTLFMAGCNLSCPFCHNGALVEGPFPRMEESEVLDFLESRKDKLTGVCITGGEPTIQEGLGKLIRNIKGMGYLVKLDTNGTRPDVLKELAAEGLLDYVAMDIKSSQGRYEGACGARPDMKAICESVGFLIEGGIPDYEFRTTIVSEYYDEATVREVGEWLKGAGRYVLQGFVDSEDVIAGMGRLHGRTREEMEAYADILRSTIKEVSLRGID